MEQILSLLLAIIAAFSCQESLAERPLSCACGWVNRGRMVGGIETDKNEYPWMAGLFDRSITLVQCGAAIVTRYHAITAAHCAHHVTNPNIVLLVGGHDLRNTRGSHMIPIYKAEAHMDFNKRPVGSDSDDIAVIVTRVPIPFGPNIGPVCLPNGPINLDHQVIKGIGWGRDGYEGKPSVVLQEINIKVVPHHVCRQQGAFLVEPKRQICVADRTASPCRGDSGGPWVWLDPETRRFTLVGVTSHGNYCAYPPPAVNTEVGAYIPWIKRIIQENKPEMICTKI